MTWQDLVIDGYERAYQGMKESLKGLTRKDLDLQPHPDCNTIGWTVWHLARVQDAQIADLAGKQQVWLEAWHERFKMAADTGATGYGDTPEQVRAFRSPSAAVLLGYFRATVDVSVAYLRKLEETDLERELDEPWFKPTPTVGVRIVSIMMDAMEHAGEIAYLRGLLSAMGKLGK